MATPPIKKVSHAIIPAHSKTEAMKKHYIFIFLLSLIIPLALQAQTHLQLHNWDAVPQSSMSNPAAIPDRDIIIGIPFLSAELGFRNSSFNINDLLRKRASDDSLTLDVSHVLTQMGTEEYISSRFQQDLFFGGFKQQKWFLSFGAYHRLDARFGFSPDALRFLWYGNEPYLNKTIDLSPTALEMQHYLVFHAGAAYQINHRFNAGIRLKYLRGLASVHTEKMDVSFQTIDDPQSIYQLQGTSDIQIQTAGLSDDDFQPIEYLSNGKNTGFAVDLGTEWQATPKITIAVAATDLGFINWKQNTKTYESTNATFQFDGIEVLEGDDNDILESLMDSISQTFNLKEYEESYKTALPACYTISGSYQFNNRHKLGAMAQMQRMANNNIPLAAIYYQGDIGSNFSFRTSYAVVDNLLHNVGLGLAVNMGALQLYTTTENVIGLISPNNAQNFGFRMGLNLRFDKVKRDAENFFDVAPQRTE